MIQLKTYRHANNPKEKEMHDKFMEKIVSTGKYAMEQIVSECDGNGNPKKLLSEDEENIVRNTIQWLGSPVGQNFLRDCGFELKTKIYY